MPVRFQFVPGQAPDLFDLPWSIPLEEWHDARLVQLARGASRHIVRFVKGAEDDDRIFALKETTESLARREYCGAALPQGRGPPRRRRRRHRHRPPARRTW
ncbi:MAG: hypothetical protein WKF58_08865 [Ilumatobacteraceae bacterium]